MDREVVRVGTRRSALALWQAHWVVERMKRHTPHLQVQVVEVHTLGDRRRDLSLSQAGGVGLFVKELERALLQGEIDLAVHSLKDLPTRLPPGLALAAIPERGDPRDALVSRTGRPLSALPSGARVGTSSRRRAAQLLALRPDLRIADIRGNVDTRLRKVEEGRYDAAILAVAGLVRLGRADRITEVLSPEIMLPAVGQGALAVEVRADDERIRSLVAPLDHSPTRAATTAERAFLARLGGGCHAPVGAYAEVDGHQIHLRALVASPDGRTIIRGARQGATSEAEALGWALAEDLLARGADALV
ncbi:MAG TPA: hydroxymethylbilane synthase [Thermoflexia bacterium]|jgi:hydroxymethylbilane synthase|nr:hydroxymethylbilane synthase [Thermoflexia bacterium]